MCRNRRAGAATEAALLSALVLWVGGSWVALAQSSDAEFQQELEKAETLLRQRRFEDALKSFKQANSLHDKKCVECYIGMARAYQGLGAHKNAIESCDDALKYAGDSKSTQAVAHNLKGVSLNSLAEKGDDKKLQEAEAEFRAALALTEEFPLARFNLGVALLRQGRDAEGVKELQAYLEHAGEDPHAADARKLLEKPRRAREHFAPDFSLTTLQGEYISSDDLQGKVVLLDFWGTWCPPCIEALPSLTHLYKKFSGQPFVAIGVSSDRDEAKWRQFIAKNKMDWPQYLDQQGRMQRLFQVRSFPTYLLIDHEGIVRYRETGWSPSKTGVLEDDIKKMLKAVAAQAKPGQD